MLHGADLRLEESPPLSVPLPFFLTAPLAIMACGGVLLAYGSGALTNSYAPVTLALTHIATLGLLTAVMMGALYQMTAVVAGSPMRRVRMAHVVHALLMLGMAALVWALLRFNSTTAVVALASLGGAVFLFAVPALGALLRTGSREVAIVGMAVAIICLLLALAVGGSMALAYAGLPYPGPRSLWIQVHVGVAILGWVGVLLPSVSWQILPMFYLAGKVREGVARSILVLTAAGALLPLLVLGVDLAGLAPDTDPRTLTQVAGWLAAPALLGIFVLHPWAALRSLQQRRRRRPDASLLFWNAGLAMAPLVACAAVAAHALPWEPAKLLFGWLALWGWAGMIMHGMLHRIVPFLVWLHRYAPLVGEVPVPSIKKLLPDRWGRIGFGLHGASLLLGCIAIATMSDPLARATGVLLCATGLWLMRSLFHVARHQPAQP